ncbi:hypothetical protein FACS1894218_0390 [Bacilli bacterium]|nr:hypothetical protein FACS1894218_0390 [Bacilli bacterium]
MTIMMIKFNKINDETTKDMMASTFLFIPPVCPKIILRIYQIIVMAEKTAMVVYKVLTRLTR